MASIPPENLTKEIQEVLQTFNHQVLTSVDEAAVEVGKTTAKYLKQISPRKKYGANSGKYSRGWKVKKMKTGEVYVHNATDYQLTHLLEKGHKIVSHGVNTGKMTRPQVHIAKAEELAQTEFPKAVARRIEYQK